MSEIPDTTVLEWAKRHGLEFGSSLDMRCAFDDAYSTPRTQATTSAAYIAAAKGLAEASRDLAGWAGCRVFCKTTDCTCGVVPRIKAVETALAAFAQQGGV